MHRNPTNAETFSKMSNKIVEWVCNWIPQSVIHVCHRVHGRSWRASSRAIYMRHGMRRKILLIVFTFFVKYFIRKFICYIFTRKNARTPIVSYIVIFILHIILYTCIHKTVPRHPTYIRNEFVGALVPAVYYYYYYYYIIRPRQHPFKWLMNGLPFLIGGKRILYVNGAEVPI